MPSVGLLHREPDPPGTQIAPAIAAGHQHPISSPARVTSGDDRAGTRREIANAIVSVASHKAGVAAGRTPDVDGGRLLADQISMPLRHDILHTKSFTNMLENRNFPLREAGPASCST